MKKDIGCGGCCPAGCAGGCATARYDPAETATTHPTSTIRNIFIEVSRGADCSAQWLTCVGPNGATGHQTAAARANKVGAGADKFHAANARPFSRPDVLQ